MGNKKDKKSFPQILNPICGLMIIGWHLTKKV
jgi:hypothetical protein